MQRVAVVLLATSALAPANAQAGGLDWQVEEDADAPGVVRALRNLRDGFVSLGDTWMDANSALIGEGALLIAKLTMVASDLVGLVDDNTVTQHVTRSVLSKPLAKTAYFWHVAGSEALLGGHGLEVERWGVSDIAALNPLLEPEDVAALEGPLPRDPLVFAGEELIHDAVYRTHSTLLGLAAIVAADGVLRPAGAVLRIAQQRSAAEVLEDAASAAFRRSTRVRW